MNNCSCNDCVQFGLSRHPETNYSVTYQTLNDTYTKEFKVLADAIKFLRICQAVGMPVVEHNLGGLANG